MLSKETVSDLLNGKTYLTEEMAPELERIMPDVEAGYWMNYEDKYQTYRVREKEQV